MNHDRFPGARARVILAKFPAQAARFHAYNRIEPGIIILAPVERIATYRVFLQLIQIAGDGPLDRQPQESLQSMRASEAFTREDPFHLRVDPFHLREDLGGQNLIHRALGRW
jgi:hypothetical protein